jgi:DNA-binding response OmpR family regulator
MAKRKILAVDDDSSICELYETGLPPLGYEVSCAYSGKQAKAFLEKETPDLILMDIMMPDQDGISLTREILSNPKTAHVPVLIISGLSDAATLNDALLFGAADYLVKPLDFGVLKTKIERLLSLVDKKK